MKNYQSDFQPLFYLALTEKYANMKYKYGNRCFWCRGYYVDTEEIRKR